MSNVILESARADSPNRRGTWVLLWVGIALLALGPLVGLLGTLFGMQSSFRAIEAEAAPTPAQLAVGDHFAQFALLAGSILGLAGLALVGVALAKIVRMNRRSV